MIDEKKIEKAAKQRVNAFRKANPDGYSTIIVDIESDCMDNFKAGVNWALQEFKKTLWHDVSEEPEEYNEWILLCYSVGNYYSLLQVKDFKSWGNFVKRIPIESWCYLSDILPKEGGEE